MRRLLTLILAACTITACQPSVEPEQRKAFILLQSQMTHQSMVWDLQAKQRGISRRPDIHAPIMQGVKDEIARLKVVSHHHSQQLAKLLLDDTSLDAFLHSRCRHTYPADAASQCSELVDDHRILASELSVDTET